MTYRWQYIRGGFDISSDLYAEDDADTIRAWSEDFDYCLAEVQREPARQWRLTGGDDPRWVDLADQRFDSPSEALSALLAVRWNGTATTAP